MPASVMSATVLPASMRSTSCGTRRALVRLVVGDDLPADANPEVGGEPAQPPGVLGGDYVGRFERLAQPRGRVSGVADRRPAQQQGADGRVLHTSQSYAVTQ